jgi:hypothetical protein
MWDRWVSWKVSKIKVMIHVYAGYRCCVGSQSWKDLDHLCKGA